MFSLTPQAKFYALSESALAAALMTVRMVAADIMVFAGVDPEQAANTVLRFCIRLSELSESIAPLFV